MESSQEGLWKWGVSLRIPQITPQMRCYFRWDHAGLSLLFPCPQMPPHWWSEADGQGLENLAYILICSIPKIMCTKKEEFWFIKVCFIIEFQPFEAVKTNWLYLFLFQRWILIKKRKKKVRGIRRQSEVWWVNNLDQRVKSISRLSALG